MKDEREEISIQVQSPLPMHVAGALLQLIGAAWPDATVNSDGRPHLALDIRVPNEAAKTVDQEFIDTIKAGNEPVTDTQFLGFRDGWVAFSPPEELCLELGQVAHAIMTAHEPDAVNHVEWTVLTGREPDDPRYVLSISRSKGQTPLAMRKAAETRVEMLEKLLEENGIAVP